MKRNKSIKAIITIIYYMKSSKINLYILDKIMYSLSFTLIITIKIKFGRVKQYIYTIIHIKS